MKKYGFTLIELLVVVLIIGILAAIAVPRYMKIIEQSKFAEAKLWAKAMGDAQDRYRELNGIPTFTIAGLDIVIPDTKPMPASCMLSTAVDGKVEGKNFYFCIDIVNTSTWYGTPAALRKNGKYQWTGYIWSQKRLYCVEGAGSGKMCKTLLGGEYVRTESGWDLFNVGM